jgi:catechol 2,3-dioxygenase-like lactoylglutathione lyase family enzyme
MLHASVNTAGAIDETMAFYRDVLGVEEKWRPDLGIPGTWFSVGNAELHLIGFPSSDAPIDPSRHHVAFGVTDLDGAVAELEAAGVSIATSAQHQSGREIRQVFFVDPAGNTIELQQDGELQHDSDD